MVAQEFKSLTVLEASDLARILKKDLGLPDVSAVAAAPAAAAPAASAPAAAAPAAAEKTEFELKLESFGDQKIQVEARVPCACCLESLIANF
jgi:large subunit ribosomal protein L7/L12